MDITNVFTASHQILAYHINFCQKYKE